ncbi:MAG: SDR family NAD(P)-dependent oxidoreductase [Pseudomonadota bacterium]
MKSEQVLAGKVALVTGAARGIGAATARLLARDGAQVFLSDVGDCAPVVDEIVQAGGKASSHPLDIRDRAGCADLTGEILKRCGQLDYLVCNAGVCPAGSVAGDWDQWRYVLDVNVDGTQNCVAAAWPAMSEAGFGSIVLVSSMAFYRGGVIVGSEYSASKGALIGMTRHLARNGGPLGIRCNAVAPGIIDTPMTEDFDKPELEDIPLRRLGSAEDVAHPIRFLCGPESAYMTGTVLNVTGGIVLAA